MAYNFFVSTLSWKVVCCACLPFSVSLCVTNSLLFFASIWNLVVEYLFFVVIPLSAYLKGKLFLIRVIDGVYGFSLSLSFSVACVSCRMCVVFILSLRTHDPLWHVRRLCVMCHSHMVGCMCDGDWEGGVDWHPFFTSSRSVFLCVCVCFSVFFLLNRTCEPLWFVCKTVWFFFLVCLCIIGKSRHPLSLLMREVCCEYGTKRNKKQKILLGFFVLIWVLCCMGFVLGGVFCTHGSQK